MNPDNFDPTKVTGRFWTNNILGVVAAILLLAIMASLFADLANADVEVNVGTIYGQKVEFNFETQDLQFTTQIIKDVDPATCVAEATAIQDAYRSNEMISMSETPIGADWTPKSYAFCTFTQKTVPTDDSAMSISINQYCEFNYDPANGDVVAQVATACP